MNYKRLNSVLNMALEWSTHSKDPKTQVGAVIFSDDFRKFSIGYNGFARGVPDSFENWSNDKKHEFVIHAEENAILNCPFDTLGMNIAITHKPCHKCLSRLINAGITKVYYIHDYDGKLMDKQVFDEVFFSSQLKIEKVNPPTPKE